MHLRLRRAWVVVGPDIRVEGRKPRGSITTSTIAADTTNPMAYQDHSGRTWLSLLLLGLYSSRVVKYTAFCRCMHSYAERQYRCTLQKNPSI
jgi:hypothetical protein